MNESYIINRLGENVRDYTGERVLRTLAKALKEAARAVEGTQDRTAVLIFVLRTAIAMQKDLRDTDMSEMVVEIEEILGIQKEEK